ncbi:MAG: hypothetical protein GXP04_08530 [Alphaproteobacteria bacterium]|nr:hypothetical protein [Alphaproteobacteria bacterium]
MNKKPPIIITAIATIFLVAFGLTLETFFTELGLVQVVKGGWKVIVDAGSADWIRWGVLFSTGAALALWSDYYLRKLTQPKQIYHGEFRFILPENGRDEPVIEKTKNIKYWHYNARGSLTILIEFESSVEKPVLAISSDKENLSWSELHSSSNCALIKIDGNVHGARVSVHFIAQNQTEKRRQIEYVTNEVDHIKNYDGLVDFENQVNEFFDKPRWKRLFQKFKYVKKDDVTDD